MVMGGRPRQNPLEDSKEDLYLRGGMDAVMHD